MTVARLLRKIHVNSTQSPASRGPLLARVVALAVCVMGMKIYAVDGNATFMPDPWWRRLFWFGQDAGLVLLLSTALWAAGKAGRAVRERLVYAACVGVALANGLLALSAGVRRGYPSLSEPMRELGRQLTDIVSKDGAAVRLALLAGALLLLAVAAAWGAALGRGAARAFERRPRLLRGVIAATCVYVIAGVVAFHDPGLSCTPIHRNPLYHYLRGGVVEPALYDDGAAAATVPEIASRLAVEAARAGAKETPAGISELLDERTNVILVVLESVGANALELGGGDPATHPFLHRVAPQSVVYRRFQAVAPHSKNALAAIFCGLYRLPGLPVSQVLPRCRALAGWLRERGVQTAWFMSSPFGGWIPRSFYEAFEFEQLHDARAIADQRRAANRSVDIADGDILQEHETVTELLSWATERCQAQEPFLGVYYSWVAHSPYRASHAGAFSFDQSLPNKARHRQLIRVLDAQLERIYEALVEVDCGRPTLMLVTGDHSEAFEEHRGNLYHSAYPYQENLWVPLYVIGEGLTGRVIDRVATHVDLAPTVAELLVGEEGRAQTQTSTSGRLPWAGRSLLHEVPPWPAFGVSLLGDGMVSVRFGQYKLIRNPSTARLFDTDADPLETRDLRAQHPALTQAMHQALDHWAVGLRQLYRHPG